jgi:hypothetical protein
MDWTVGAERWGRGGSDDGVVRQNPTTVQDTQAAGVRLSVLLRGLAAESGRARGSVHGHGYGHGLQRSNCAAPLWALCDG